jgi:hypothetical protein
MWRLLHDGFFIGPLLSYPDESGYPGMRLATATFSESPTIPTGYPQLGFAFSSLYLNGHTRRRLATCVLAFAVVEGVDFARRNALESAILRSTMQSSERLKSLFLQSNLASPILFLGAGASLKSGIPLSGQVVEMAAKWAYCQGQGFHLDDPSVRRSDWLKWLERHSWFDGAQQIEDNYSAALGNLCTSSASAA